jgi:hypothetical protein
VSSWHEGKTVRNRFVGVSKISFSKSYVCDGVGCYWLMLPQIENPAI